MTNEKKAAVTKYHRQTLLSTADRLLMQYGYDGMNMNMLAKEAGYSKATVYVYFRSKDEIVRCLAVERLKLMRAEISLLVKSDSDVAEKLAEVRSVIEEFAAEDRAYFDFVSGFKRETHSGDDEAGAAELAELIDGILDELTPLAPSEELKRMWYGLYGRIKTRGMFGDDGQ